jgi:DNA polymerase III alpha subunit (gram-positive type)
MKQMKTIILDFETSGLNPYHDDIIEIAMKVLGSEEQFTCLLRPKSNECISLTITTLTGITNKMLAKDGLRWEEAYQLMNAWLFSIKEDDDKITIVSHNGESFDFLFLKRIFSDLKILKIKPFPIHKIIFADTLLLAKRLISGRSTYRQTTLCQQYNIVTEGSHRALNDVIALEQLYVAMTTKLHEKLGKRRKPIEYPQMIQDYIHFKN